jgi:hypothetical protein
MVVAGIINCDRCKFGAFPDDYTAIRIERNGHVHVFQYHNSSGAACLAQEILELKQRFASAKR